LLYGCGLRVAEPLELRIKLGSGVARQWGHVLTFDSAVEPSFFGDG